jgi:phage-related protein
MVNGAFNAVKNTAVNVFNGLKSFLSNWGSTIVTFAFPLLGIPMQIISHWGQIRGFFSNLASNIKQKLHDMFNFQIPHIPLPHFNISGKLSLNPPSMPSIGVNWYAKGGIFSSPSVIGVGDASSPEAVVPLDKLQGFINNAVQQSGGMGGSNQPIYITVVSTLDGREVARGTSKYMSTELGQSVDNKNKGKGAW